MRAKAIAVLEVDLDRLESEYRVTLRAALERCAAGHWGLFGQDDHVVEANPNLERLLFSQDRADLAELADQIRRLASNSDLQSRSH